MGYQAKHSFLSAIALVAMESMACPVPLTYELLATPSGSKATVSADGKSVSSYIGDAVQLELWVMIDNPDRDSADDAYMFGQGSFLSSTGGGKVDLGGVQILAPWTTGTIQLGRKADLDGDGDLEIGALDGNQASDQFFQAWDNRLAQPLFGTGNGPTTNFKIATLVATLRDTGNAEINFVPRNRTEGAPVDRLKHWVIQDGRFAPLSGVSKAVEVGAAIRVRVEAIPEPATLCLVLFGVAGTALVAGRRDGASKASQAERENSNLVISSQISALLRAMVVTRC